MREKHGRKLAVFILLFLLVTAVGFAGWVLFQELSTSERQARWLHRYASKTGTGDHRYEIYGKGGVLIGSRVVNRTATFAFMIGDRYFGTITAFVPGPDAAQYGFTSSLPVAILKALAPKLMPLLDSPGEGGRAQGIR